MTSRQTMKPRMDIAGVLTFCLLAGMRLHAGPFDGKHSAPAGTPRAVRLEHRFETGTEWVYEFTSDLSQEISISGRDLSYQMTLTGMARQVVADVDPKRGIALIGQIAQSRWERREGSADAPVTSKEQTWDSAWRIDRAGRSIRRAPVQGEVKESAFYQTASQIGECAQICAAFPSKELNVGSQWKGSVLLPLPGMRLPAEGVSTLVAAGETNGAWICVIRTTVPSESWQAHSDWLPDAKNWLPDITVTGSSLGHFDVGRGVWLRVEWDLNADLGGSGFEGRMRVRSTTDLKSAGKLPEDAAAEWRQRIVAFDAAVAKLYETNGVAQAVKLVGHLQKTETNADWLKGLYLTAAVIDPAYRVGSYPGFDTQGEVRDASPQRTMIGDADLAALAGNWSAAVSRYKTVADTYPRDEVAPQALGAAASICERRLGDGAQAAELRAKLVAWREARAAGETNRAAKAFNLYRLASAYVEAGALGKATDAFERFLSFQDEEIPETMRVLARYRVGGLLDKMGQRDKALAAYQAVLDMPAEADYSRKLQDTARKNVEKLRNKP